MIDIASADMQLKLLTSRPIYVQDIPVLHISLNHIADMGYRRYNELLHILSMQYMQVKSPDGSKETQIDAFDYLLLAAYRNKEMREIIYSAFELFTGCRPAVNRQDGCFDFPGTKFQHITKEMYADFQLVLKERNGIRPDDEVDENPLNEKARELLARRRELREKVRKAKRNKEGSDITLADLVSILAGGLKMPLHEIMEYDMYQFNNQFNRLRIFKDYDVNVQALLAGAKKEDVNLQHWISKIDTGEADS